VELAFDHVLVFTVALARLTTVAAGLPVLMLFARGLVLG
jgi:hypothetical protein